MVNDEFPHPETQPDVANFRLGGAAVFSKGNGQMQTAWVLGQVLAGMHTAGMIESEQEYLRMCAAASAMEGNAALRGRGRFRGLLRQANDACGHYSGEVCSCSEDPVDVYR